MKFFVTSYRLSHADSSINNGEGNAPKDTNDGQLYGSSGSTKRQKMEASGITKDTRNLRYIAEKYGIPYENTKKATKKATKQADQEPDEPDQSADKHSIPWDESIEADFQAKVQDKSITTFGQLKLWAINTKTQGAKLYGHLNVWDGSEPNRIDGLYGTTGHRGIHRGRARIAIDMFVLQSTVNDNENFGKRKIALEEHYWSRDTFTFNGEYTAELKAILKAQMCEPLTPRANRNNGNILSCEFTITTISTKNTTVNWPSPPQPTDLSCKSYLHRLRAANKGRELTYLVYTTETITTDDTCIIVDNPQDCQIAIDELIQ